MLGSVHNKQTFYRFEPSTWYFALPVICFLPFACYEKKNKKPSCRCHYDGWPYCLTEDYLVIGNVSKQQHQLFFTILEALSSLTTWPFGSSDVIGHVTIRLTIGHFYWWSLEPSLHSNGFRDIQWQMWCNRWHDFKRPINEGQGYSFWYELIPHIRLPIGC